MNGKLTYDAPSQKFLWEGGFETKDAVKAAGFRWDPKITRWWTPSIENAKKLAAYADKPALDVIAGSVAQAVAVRSASAQSSSDYKAPVPAGLDYFPFQKAFLKFLKVAKTNRPGVLLADQMGLGKTPQALGAINDNANDYKNILLVCPASLKLNWKREAEKWLVIPHDIKLVTTKDKELPTGERRLTIVNYDILLRLRDTLFPVEWDLIICDESQALKNYKAKRTQALLGGLLDTGEENKTLLKSLKAKFWIFLSGTPIMNRPNELWTTVKKLDPSGLGDSWKKYHFRYCGAKFNGFGYDYSGATNLDELQEKLRSSFMIRRLKKDVQKEIPDKTRRIIALEAQTKGTEKKIQTEKALNDKAEECRRKIAAEREKAKAAGKTLEETGEAEFVANLSAVVGETIDEMTKLRVELAKLKAEECLPLLVDYAEQEPILIFTHHHECTDSTLAGLQKAGLRAKKFDGRDSIKTRDETVTEFQEGKLDALVLGIKAAGVGITLTRATHVIFLEMDWTSTAMAQAEDRAHRIGQSLPVTITYLVYDNSMDAHMAQLLLSKEVVIAQAMDNTEEVAGPTPEEAAAEFLAKAEAERKKVEAENERKKLEAIAADEEKRKRLLESSVKVTGDPVDFLIGFFKKSHQAAVGGLIWTENGGPLHIRQSFGVVYVDGKPAAHSAGDFLVKFGAITSAAHFGKCSHCARELTDPESIARGIGPTCLKYYQG